MRTAIVAAFLLSACSTGSDLDRTPLGNSSGKDDSVSIRLKLTDSSSVAGFSVGCDQPAGCEGTLSIKLKTPEPCALFPDEPRCGIARTSPLAKEVLHATVLSSTEGERKLPLRVESGDGQVFTKDIAAAFTAVGNEEVEITLEKAMGTPELVIEVRAEWKSKANPEAEIEELRTFLGTVAGLTYTEIGTASTGYRAFLLQYEQPLDHGNPMAGTFKQQIVLHHRFKISPMVLYTSGYSLFSQDDLSEISVGLQANQLSTEQRWFGSSRPATVTPESWKLVTIEQAAKDHHRIVEALKPFYSGKWLSTGHSKGGMTSIYHRRFFPADIDATVAYVAPISFADPDKTRYAPFLDRIGEVTCREAIRAIQKKALEQIDQLVPLAQAAHDPGATFVRAGGLASALEKDILGLEWSFWQYYKADQCQPFMAVPGDVNAMFTLLSQYTGIGYPDSAVEDRQFLAYDWQAATELGRQGFATAHLGALVKHEAIKMNMAPTGTMPVHSRAAMDDIQAWVKSSGSKLLFLYGESDPWTGGAFEIGTQSDVLKLVAPKAPHGALLADLPAADRERATAAIEQWIGTKPAITGPLPALRPAMPRTH